MDTTYWQWEVQVTHELERLHQVTRSDAQAIVEGQPAAMAQAWARRLTPYDTAKAVDAASDAS